MRIITLTQWKAYVIALVLTMFSTALFAQTSTVRGKIVDEKGEPLIGATIRANGTQTVSTTNVNGEFTLNVPATATTISISYIGYNSLEKSIAGQNGNLGNIPLTKNNNNLSDVVVVGYGTLRKQDVTGTVVNVDAKVLQEIPASNFAEQLKGRVAGVDITSGTNGPIISVRGNRTIGAAPGLDGPLIVLDGQPYYSSIENINPNDIKSIDVLKGASATAIYGSRASGGVLLITTNRGRVGQTITSYDSYVGLSKLEGSLELLNGPQFAQLQSDALQGAVLQNSSQSNPYQLTAIEKRALAEGVSTDYVDLLLKRSMIWDQSLRVSSGTEKTQFTVGAGYRVNTGLQPNNSSKRISLNATLDHRISKVIKFGLTTQTTVRLLNSGGGDQLLTARYISPLTYPFNPDGSLNPTPQSDQVDATFLNPLLPGRNPDQYYDYTRGFQHNDILYGELSPIDHFKYRYTFNYNFNQSLQGTYRGINNVDIVDATRTTASTVNNYSYMLAQEHLLTYDNTFNTKHHLNFVAVFRNEKRHNENSNINGTGIPFNAVKNSNIALANTIAAGGSYVEQGLLSYIARVNYAFDSKYDLTASVTTDGNSALATGNKYTTYPSVGLGWVLSNEEFIKKYSFIDNLKLRAGYGITSTTNTITPYSTLGQLSSSTYQYGGSSAGNAQGVRFTNLTNPTLTWQRTHETNIALDFGIFKNRITGSIEVYKQKTTGIILQNILPITNGASSQVSNLGTSANNGLEITLSSINLQNVGGFTWSTDYNMSFSREKIVELPNGAQINIGSGLFVGQPLSVIYDVKKIGIWQLSDSPGIDASKNQSNGPVYLPVRGQAGGPNQYPGQIRVEDYNKDGKIDANDNQIIGNFQPKYQFGMTNRFSYKNFDLSIVIQGKMKFTTVVPYVSSANSTYVGWQYLNIGRHNQPVIDYWTPTNPTNAFPMPNAQTQGNYYSTLQYYDGSYIRAKSINVGYNLPSNLTKRIGLNSLRVYANVTNPFIIYAPIMNHSFTVTDPESVYNQQVINTSTSGNLGGQDNNFNNYRGLSISPGLQTRDFIIGINARF